MERVGQRRAWLIAVGIALATLCAGALALTVDWRRPTLQAWSLDEALSLVALVGIGEWLGAPLAVAAAGLAGPLAVLLWVTHGITYGAAAARASFGSTILMLLPAPLCAATIARFVRRDLRVWITALSGVSVILVSGAVFAYNRWRADQLRGIRVPAVVQSVRQAEFNYAGSNGGFTCDGTKLPFLGRLDWMPSDTLTQNGVSIQLKSCSGRRLRIWVRSPGHPDFFVDQTGRITLP